MERHLRGLTLALRAACPEDHHSWQVGAVGLHHSPGSSAPGPFFCMQTLAFLKK